MTAVSRSVTPERLSSDGSSTIPKTPRVMSDAKAKKWQEHSLDLSATLDVYAGDAVHGQLNRICVTAKRYAELLEQEARVVSGLNTRQVKAAPRILVGQISRLLKSKAGRKLTVSQLLFLLEMVRDVQHTILVQLPNARAAKASKLATDLEKQLRARIQNKIYAISDELSGVWGWLESSRTELRNLQDTLDVVEPWRDLEKVLSEEPGARVESLERVLREILRVNVKGDAHRLDALFTQSLEKFDILTGAAEQLRAVKGVDAVGRLTLKQQEQVQMLSRVASELTMQFAQTGATLEGCCVAWNKIQKKGLSAERQNEWERYFVATIMPILQSIQDTWKFVDTAVAGIKVDSRAEAKGFYFKLARQVSTDLQKAHEELSGFSTEDELLQSVNDAVAEELVVARDHLQSFSDDLTKHLMITGNPITAMTQSWKLRTSSFAPVDDSPCKVSPSIAAVC